MPSVAPDAILRQVGLRVTPQRSLVLEALMRLPHPDAEAVFGYARQRQPNMSLATVYNVLDKLRGVGLAAMLEYRGRRHFDVRVERHDHVHCRGCGLIADIERHANTRVVCPEDAAWIIEDQALVWEGLCPSCRTG
jgi:Fe2+ or Zn2+ uptake regulation protein